MTAGTHTSGKERGLFRALKLRDDGVLRGAPSAPVTNYTGKILTLVRSQLQFDTF